MFQLLPPLVSRNCMLKASVGAQKVLADSASLLQVGDARLLQ